MDICNYSDEEISEIENRLSYTWLNVHENCATVKSTVMDLCKILENREDNIRLQEVYKRIAVYLAFIERDNIKSSIFF